MNPRTTTVTIEGRTAELIDQGRAALAETTGKLSRAAFLAAAVENYTADLAEQGHPIDAVDDERSTDLAGTRIPFRPRAQWALVDTTTIPHHVQLATGRGPGGKTVLTVVAEVLPHIAPGGRYGTWRDMLDLAGYHVDDTRDPDNMSDGRDMIPIRP